MNQESWGYLNLKSILTLSTHEIKLKITKSKVILSVLYALWNVTFFHQEKKTKYLTWSIPKISIYLFMHFYFFCFISTKLADFAFLKIQMQITFAKLFNVLNNTMLQKLWLVHNFIKFLLSTIFPSLSEFPLRI